MDFALEACYGNLMPRNFGIPQEKDIFIMNWKLFLNILSSVNGGLISGAALFNPLIGQDLALKVISGFGIAQIIVSAINSQLSTQGNQISAVAAMTGVEKVLVNATATNGVAAAALDKAQPKVGAVTPEVRQTLIKNANA
jgi:hypothetical protein